MLKSRGARYFGWANGVILVILALTCILPFIHILAISLSSNAAVSAGRVTLWPQLFTSYAYEYLLQKQQFWVSFWVSLQRIVLGGGINMAVIILCAYPLSKTRDRFKYRSVYVAFFFFTMLFSGGLIPQYMLLSQLDLLDSIWSLVLPGAVPVFNIILMLNFFRQLPRELEEAAHMDGAGHFRTLFSIYLPCSLPAVATLLLFTIVGHWNSWFDGLIFMNSIEKYPLQSYIQTIVVGMDMLGKSMGATNYDRMSELSDRTLRSAQIIIATIPILLVYPLLQKYFVTGLVMGSVKG